MGNPKSNVRASAAVAKAITLDAAEAFDALYVGVTGDIQVDTEGGNTAILFKSVPVGFFPVSVTKVYTANTTASQILGLRW